LPIRIIMLLVIGNQIRQCEAVMRGDEIDGRPGPAPATIEKVSRGGDARCELRQHAFVTAPITADGIAITIVPFSPTGWKLTQLIASHPDVPGLRDELRIGKPRRLADGIEKAAALIETMIFPTERRRQVKTEAVDMHFLNPI